MAPRVLVLNAGSSTLKASVVEPVPHGAPPVPAVAAITIELGDDASANPAIAAGFDAALTGLVDAGGPPETCVAVAHRVVHGGSTFRGPAVVDDDVLDRIGALTPLAPIHQPVAIAAIRAARAQLADMPHVAVFDTAFHADLAEAAWRYPVPRDWDRWGIRRHGFHGLSVEWAVERSAALLGRPAAELGIVCAHLGNGASVTAVAGGRSVATSMGMTPLEGLMMGTRAGSIDPGILLALLRDGRLDVDGLADALDHRSGLLAVSGSSGDMRELEAAKAGGDAAAALAIEMFVDRAAAAIAAAATALARLDALVFTGGIGSGSSVVRGAIVARLGALHVPPAAVEVDGDGVVGGDGDGPTVLRIEAREDIVAARAALHAIARAGEPG